MKGAIKFEMFSCVISRIDILSRLVIFLSCINLFGDKEFNIKNVVLGFFYKTIFLPKKTTSPNMNFRYFYSNLKGF